MTVVNKLMQHKAIVGIIAVAMAAFMFGMQPAFGVTTTDTFGIDAFGQSSKLKPTSQKQLPAVVADIIDVALGLLGIVAVVIILAGGFKWMTAGGNDDKVGEAKKLIVAGVIGLIIILAAYAIAQFVLGSISAATETGNVPGFTAPSF